MEGQIGLENDPQIFIDKLVGICDEIKRVLKKSGSFYLNIGDKYKDKQLLMIPSRVVIALQDNGWILRNIIIWHKPNPLPSPFKDRLSNTYEFVFHLVRNKKYYYDLNSIRIPHKEASLVRLEYGFKQLPRAWDQDATPIPGGKNPNFQFHKEGRNPGDVTEYDSKYKDKDFGQTPQAFARVNSIEKERKLSRKDAKRLFPGDKKKQQEYINYIHEHSGHPDGKNPGDVTDWKELDSNKEDVPRVSTLWKPADAPRTNHPSGKGPGDYWNIPTQAFTAYNPELEHFSCFPEKLVINPLKSSCPPEGIVLDPFCGRGTVGKVAKSLGMHYILFDIKPEYCELARLFIGGQKHKIDKNQKELGEFKNDI